MRTCDFDLSNSEVVFLTRCYAGEDSAGKIREANNCRVNFAEILEGLNEDAIIVPMGATCAKVLVGNKTNIQAAHGSLTEIDGRRYIPTLHPLAVLNYPDNLEIFVQDLQRLSNDLAGEVEEHTKTSYQLIETMHSARKMFKHLNASERFTFDIESTSLNPYNSKPHPASVLMVAFSAEEGQAYLLPLEHKEAPWTPSELVEIKALLKDCLEDTHTKKAAHNGKFDTKYLRATLGIETSWDFDTLMAHYVAINEEPGTHSLKVLAWEYTDMGGYDDELEAYKQEHPEADPDKGGHYGNIPLEIIWKYAAADADCTFRLWTAFEPKVEEGFTELYYNHVIPSVKALARIEGNGALVDKKYKEECQREYPRLLAESLKRLREFPEVLKVEKRLTRQAREKKEQERMKRFKERLIKAKGMELGVKRESALNRLTNDIEKFKANPPVIPPIVFNPGSPDQKRELIYGVMKLPIRKYTKNREPSTDKEVIKELYEETKSDLIKELGKYTKISTLYKMFVKPLDELICDDGRLRGGYNPAGTVTGRLSCSEPNLQQIPKNIKEDAFLDVAIPSIKRLFVAPKNHVLLQFDYSQAELRVLASLSGDQTLIKAYENNEDIHKSVAAEVEGIELDDVNDEQRGRAKTLNFGLLYGQGAAKMARMWGITLDEAKGYINKYFKRLPGVKKYIAQVKAHVRRVGFVTSCFGRVRRLSGVFSGADDLVAQAERQAVNAPIQGTASDCTLEACIRINYNLAVKGLKSRIIITVHDSIILECPFAEAVRVYKLVKKIMQSPSGNWLKVPFTADAEVGVSWGKLTKLESAADLEKFLGETFRAA